ncbi:hypothetical protein SCLCIDRAFT_1016832 [Scleroderma citrinum Foug A]|uniref:Uncharacterized protein n=1 Tax=Scleroderma citrinum Foug A TaxID=1036808 RepID=A0A0C3ATK9_9AGAM|nr:hypothetical protein SCLCIDRAFT_1016832 [Scleroderma citrinum Foug A]
MTEARLSCQSAPKFSITYVIMVGWDIWYPATFSPIGIIPLSTLRGLVQNFGDLIAILSLLLALACGVRGIWGGASVVLPRRGDIDLMVIGRRQYRTWMAWVVNLYGREPSFVGDRRNERCGSLDYSQLPRYCDVFDRGGGHSGNPRIPLSGRHTLEVTSTWRSVFLFASVTMSLTLYIAHVSPYYIRF